MYKYDGWVRVAYNKGTLQLFDPHKITNIKKCDLVIIECGVEMKKYTFDYQLDINDDKQIIKNIELFHVANENFCDIVKEEKDKRNKQGCKIKSTNNNE